MKIHQYNQMMKYLTRPSRKATEEKAREELKLPKDTKLTGSKMLNWVNYNNKVHGNNNEPITEEEKKVAAGIEAEQNKTEKFRYQSWADGLEERTKPAKKAPIKKVVDSSLTKPQKSLPFQLDKYLDLIDPQWWLPEDYRAVPLDEDEARRLKKIRTGITKLI